LILKRLIGVVVVKKWVVIYGCGAIAYSSKDLSMELGF
jgi:hypothetical protein